MKRKELIGELLKYGDDDTDVRIWGAYGAEGDIEGVVGDENGIVIESDIEE